MKILVVEDDQAIARTLQLLLSSYSYAVDVAADGETGWQMAEAYEYDLMLLDVMLPGLDGVSLCQQLRKAGYKAPILLLTGHAGGQQTANTSWSIANALNAGADDYVVKPFDTEELMARVQALLRRGKAASQPVLNCGQLSLDPSTRRVAYGTSILSITPKEYGILELLLRNPQKALSPRAMLNQVWSSLESPGEEAVRVHIKELRRKLTRLGAPKDFIKTIHRAGYQLNPQYSNFLATQVQEQPTAPHVAELTKVNEELRLTLEELQVAEEELREQNEQLELVQQSFVLERLRYQDLFEHAPDAYLVTSIHGVIQETNRVASDDLFHVKPQFLIGKPLIVFIAKDDRANFRLRLARLNFAQNWELNIIRKGGNLLPVLAAVTAIKNLQNEVTGLRWLLRDIRPRKEQEQQLQAISRQLIQEENVDVLYEQILNVAIALMRSDFGSLQMLDSERQELHLLAWKGFHPDSAAHWKIITGESITSCGGALRVGERQIVPDVSTDDFLKGDDNLRYFQLSGIVAMQSTPLVTRDGRIVGMISTHWRDRHVPNDNELKMFDVVARQAADLLDRKQAAEALRKSEQKYRSLFESIDQGFCLIELLFDANNKAIDYRFIETNAAFEQQSGLVNATGKTILELVPNLEPQWAELYGQVAKSGNAARFEADVPSMNRVFDIYTFPSGAPGQNLVAVLFADITERKRTEEILRQTAELDAFRISLVDALRPSTDASEIQAIAARLLGELLQATRVIYIEVVSNGEEAVVRCNYTNGVAALSGHYRLEDYGRNLTADHQAGHTQIVTDIPANSNYTDAEKARYRELEIAAHIDVPLLKNNQFVALLAVHQSTPRQWTETEVKLVEETAERTWAAVERARAETALTESEGKYRSILTTVDEGLLIAEVLFDEAGETVDYRCLEVNPAFYVQTGLSTDVVGMTMREIAPGKPIPWLPIYGQVVKSQQAVRFDYDIELEELRGYYDVHILPLGHPSDHRVAVLFKNITDRKRTEQKIQEQAALLDITADAISVRDLDHRILYWNQGAVQLYGWLATEAIGQPALQLLHANLDQIAAIMQTLSTHGEWRGELYKTTKTGKTVIVETQWTLMRDATGQPQSILSVDTDITDKKQLETQFYRAQRLESLGTLASGIAHDLNNVLTPILAISQLLRSQQPDLHPQSQEMLQLLEDSAKRGANLLQQILTFTRGAGGERHPVKVSAVVQEVFNIVQQSFPKTITIRRSIPDPCNWFVAADSTYLHQVLMNLCINARDAMPNGGVLSLAVEPCFVDQTVAQANLDVQMGHYIVITIADTGSGIPTEVRDRIFDPFFTTKPSGQGTGLGLATVLGIVKEYGGFLQVLSEVDRGTQMKVYLPIIEGIPTSSESSEQPLDGHGELVLLVDDDIAVQRSTHSLLENYHYTVLSTNNGMEAIALYTQHQNDISTVILDIMMPTMSGITLIQKLRDINPTVRIMALSGLPTNREPALAAGANAFLPKPYVLKNLLETLQTLIARKG